MTFQTIHVGKTGEKLAVKYLLENNFRIMECNYHTKYGEIDIVAQKNNIFHFVEVKTRIGIEKGKPYEAVNSKKLQHLKTASELYVLKNKLKNAKLSLMIVSIVLNQDLSVESLKSFKIEE